MRKDAAFVGKQRGPVRAHRLARGDVFFVHGMRLGKQPLFDLRQWHARFGQVREKRLHPVDRPEEVDRRGTGGGETCADALELRREFVDGVGLTLLCAQRHAVRRRNADGRRAADHHGDDGVGHLIAGCSEHVALFEGELGLVDEADALGSPSEGGNHAIPV